MLWLKSNDTEQDEEARVCFLQKDNLLVVLYSIAVPHSGIQITVRRASLSKLFMREQTHINICNINVDSVMNTEKISTLYIADSLTLLL